MQEAGAKFGPIERLVWTYYVIPRVREGFIQRRSRLAAFIADQAPWGPGRVDTFNPYKLVQMQMGYATLAPGERNGASDFPSIFNQAPREGMKLHWDGNNNSLRRAQSLGRARRRRHSASPSTIAAIERVANMAARPQAPAEPAQAATRPRSRAARALYMRECAACHGSQGDGGYKFTGAQSRQGEPNANLGADPGRLNSYTEAFRQRQLNELFAGTPYQF